MIFGEGKMEGESENINTKIKVKQLFKTTHILTWTKKQTNHTLKAFKMQDEF